MSGKIKLNEQKKAIIHTEKFYIKYGGMCDFHGECLVNQETEKAYLIRIWNGNNFSTSGQWIPKSKIISFEYVEKLPSEIKIEEERLQKILKALNIK